MGGKAFAASLLNARFPRLPTAQYENHKNRLLPVVQRHFRHVGVPVEAPEKVDHGDLDFLAYGPLAPDEKGDMDFQSLQNALGAKVCLPMRGNRTSNFAIALAGEGMTEDDYLQVDVHVCEDEAEFKRIMFFHSYGDMGMLMGLVAKGVGLHVGTKGLETDTLKEDADYPVPSTFMLSTDFDTILPFFGWDQARYNQGFSTKAALADWIMSSRFYLPQMIQDPNRKAKSRKDRAFYHDFIAYATQIAQASEQNGTAAPPPSRVALRAQAIAHFGKEDEWTAACTAKRQEADQLKAIRHVRENLLSSKRVSAWTGVDPENWRLMKNLISMIREEYGGEEHMRGLTEEEVRDAAFRVLPRAEELAKAEWEEWIAKKALESAARAGDIGGEGGAPAVSSSSVPDPRHAS